MREILFKAKCAEEPYDWVEGYLNKCEREFIISNDDGLGVFIKPDTICQYTGLTDKNGNKIWENDILRGHGNPNDLAKVVFGEFAIIEVDSLEKVDSAVGWYTEVIPTDAISKCEPFCLSMPLTDFYISYSELETIGNIFDNPEFLKEE